MNYEYMVSNQIAPFVKYKMFHKEMKRKFLKNPFHQANMFYSQEQDFFVCPMGQHMEHVAYKKTVSDLVDEAKRNSGGAFRQLIITL